MSALSAARRYLGRRRINMDEMSDPGFYPVCTNGVRREPAPSPSHSYEPIDFSQVWPMFGIGTNRISVADVSGQSKHNTGFAQTHFAS
jgi:hypothetical protein